MSRILKNKNSLGFTLVELIVIIAIIGILATFGYTNYVTQMKRARDGRRKADLEQIRSALEMCYADTGSYPAGPLYSGGTIACGGKTYMVIPNDPSPGRKYYYNRLPLNTYEYELCAALEAESGSGSCAPSSGCGTGTTCNYRVTNP